LQKRKIRTGRKCEGVETESLTGRGVEVFIGCVTEFSGRCGKSKMRPARMRYYRHTHMHANA